MELEARWRPKSSFANHQIEPHCEISHHEQDIDVEPRNTLPKYRNFNQSSNFDRLSLRSGRDPSEDSAIGTLSTNSETGFSHASEVPRRHPRNQVINDRPMSRPCSFTVDIAASQSSHEMSDSNHNKTYSRKTFRTGQQRMSIQNILDSPLGNETDAGVTVKPLSAMKNDKPLSNFPPKPVRTSNPFVQSQQHSQIKNRPKSAMGERFNSQMILYSEDSDEPISEPESLFENGSRMTHATTSNGKMNAIKLKMEEKRKNIQLERAKLEAARQKQRQKMGKTAFMRVMRNTDTEKSTNKEYGNHSEVFSDDEQSFTDHSLTDASNFHSDHAARTLSDKVSERRGRAKSIHLENFDPNAVDRVSRQMQDVQTSTNLSRHSEHQKYPHRFSSRPNSVHER